MHHKVLPIKAGCLTDIILKKFKTLILFDVHTFLWVVLDWEVLTTNHTVSLEPLATELLGGTVWGVGPFDSNTVVVGVLEIQ